MPATPKTGEVVPVHRQLHLEGADFGVRVLGENVEDQAFPVHYVASEQLLEVALLCGCELVVEHDDVDVESVGQDGYLLGFAGADVGGRFDPGATDQFLIDRIGAGSVGEQGELVQTALGVDGGHPGQLDTDQEGPLYGNFEIGDCRGETTTASGGVFLGHEAPRAGCWRLGPPDDGGLTPLRGIGPRPRRDRPLPRR